jgi:hypothetical protein
MTNDDIAIDIASDTIRLYGVRYSLDLFRTLGAASVGGAAFRIIAREGETLTLETIREERIDANN